MTHICKLRETHMRKFSGDSIKINVDTGHNSAGNGGDGHSYGNFTNNANINFDGDNKIEKAHATSAATVNIGIDRKKTTRFVTYAIYFN